MGSRIVFFDMDGTLCVPRFHVDNAYLLGFDTENWIAFCKQRGSRAYEDCIPVGPVVRYARECERKGAILFVLTTVLSDAEVIAKEAYITERFPGLFRSVITVSRDEDKLAAMQKMAGELNCSLSDCELVEDRFYTLLSVMEYGVTPTHISSLCCEL